MRRIKGWIWPAAGGKAQGFGGVDVLLLDSQAAQAAALVQAEGRRVMVVNLGYALGMLVEPDDAAPPGGPPR